MTFNKTKNLTLLTQPSMQIKTFNGHTFDMSHIVSNSPWPFFTSFASLATVTSLTSYMHGYYFGFELTLYSIFALSLFMGFWWRDVIRESTFEGNHNSKVQTMLKIGVLLFIISEIMFFFAFFWAFFHSSLSPAINIGCVWPPKGINIIDPFALPYLNTILLLSSGASVTWCHHAIVSGDKVDGINGMVLTIVLATLFLICQYVEYTDASFTISDGIYGSCFFMATGFHGFHVFIGTTFLLVCSVRLQKNHFTKEHHIGFEAAAWYWHFVDVVWLFLFIVVYYWGS